MDKAGRIVIPKPIRDAMGLRPGVPLTIDFFEGKIAIEYAPVEARVRIAEDGFPIIEFPGGTVLPRMTDEALREAIEAVRDENLHGLL